MANKSVDMATHSQTLGIAISAIAIGFGMKLLEGPHTYVAWGLIAVGLLVLVADGAWVAHQLLKPRGLSRLVTLGLAASVVAIFAATGGYAIGRWRAPVGDGQAQPATTEIGATNPSSLVKVIGQTFTNTRVPLDGRMYVDCIFDNVTFRWDGTAPAIITGGKRSGGNRFETKSSVVGSTVDILNGLEFTTEDFRKDWKHLPDEYFNALEKK